MSKRTKTQNRHHYFNSKINRKLIEEFEILESNINFDQNKFIKDVKEEMKFRGVELEYLAKCTYIPAYRLKSIIYSNAKINESEIRVIRKYFGM